MHAPGTRHSFTGLPDTDGTLIPTDRLRIAPSLNSAARRVTVGAGTRYGVLAEWLHARGHALHNMGSLPHISIAGATATGTHGSGDRLGVLSTAVSGLEFVTSDGSVESVARGDREFDALAVGLGAFGVITGPARPARRVRQRAPAAARDAVRRCLEARGPPPGCHLDHQRAPAGDRTGGRAGEPRRPRSLNCRRRDAERLLELRAAPE